MNTVVANTIKSIVKSFIPDARVMLFGSYARGDNSKDSDYDVMIITENTFSPREKMNYRSKINRALVYALHVPVDVLVNSEKEIAVKKTFPGHIVQWALKEGVWL